MDELGFDEQEQIHSRIMSTIYNDETWKLEGDLRSDLPLKQRCFPNQVITQGCTVEIKINQRTLQSESISSSHPEQIGKTD
jgi:hypothetical protein